MSVIGRNGPTNSLYDANVVTFDAAAAAYHEKDAAGFVRPIALRVRLGAPKGRKVTDLPCSSE
jgi:argininosuccinate synthase